MSTINKICLFPREDRFPSNWKVCDGKNGTPKLDPLVPDSRDQLSIPYICCISNDYDDAEPFMGQILTTTVNFAPDGWAFCDGKILQIHQNTGLFTLIGFRFGGDGHSTFALPKIADIQHPKGHNRQPIRYIISLVGIFSM